jgi:hypothetical protein
LVLVVEGIRKANPTTCATCGSVCRVQMPMDGSGL